jgi:2,3-dihydro-2,3-dihydroxybenzoate dehydrogenase
MRLTGIEGKIALVTGAGGGIGRAVVDLLVDAGARIVATDHAAALLEVHRQHAREQVQCHVLDVRDSAAVDRLVTEVERDWGAIDLGINVAGILSTTTVVDTDDSSWRNVFAVNTDGVFHVSRALARVMSPRRRGAIVTVSSNAAGVPRHAMAAYAASKAATTMFTRCLGLELAPLGIRCNIVAPGSTLTPMQTGMWADEHGAQRVIAGVPEQFKAGIPLQKLATPQDIAQSVLFLLSDQAGHITMADLYVDGGATLRA